MASKRPTIFDVRDHMKSHREIHAPLGSVALHVFDVIMLHTLYKPKRDEEYGWMTSAESRIEFLSEYTRLGKSTVRDALNVLEENKLIIHVYDPFSKKPGRGNPKRIRNNIAYMLHARSEQENITEEG